MCVVSGIESNAGVPCMRRAADLDCDWVRAGGARLHSLQCTQNVVWWCVTAETLVDKLGDGVGVQIVLLVHR